MHAKLKYNPLASCEMKNKIPLEISLIYIHGLNLLPVAKEFKHWLANYRPDTFGLRCYAN